MVLQEKLIRRLDQEFLACARRYGLPLGDFPKVRSKAIGRTSMGLVFASVVSQVFCLWRSVTAK